mgnify:CR=1 FL=1
MTYKPYALIALFLCAQTQINAQNVLEESLEEVVVTDSRFKLKRENSGKTVIKISQQEIENNEIIKELEFGLKESNRGNLNKKEV